MEIGFFVFGLAFFLYVVGMTQRSEDRMYQRKLNEQREFGYRDVPKKSFWAKHKKE